MTRNLTGTLISITGQGFNALGINLQRYAHTVNSNKPLISRLPFLLGLLCLGLTEIFNFIALSFAPVSTIAPLGSVSIIASAILGQLFFSETVQLKGYFGIILITIGTFLAVLTGPSSSKDFSVDEFLILFNNPIKRIYFISLFIIMILIFIFGGNNLYLTIGLAAISTGNTVTLSKAMAVFVKLSLTVENQLTHFLPYCIIAFIVASIVLQVNRINVALENNPAYLVNSLYFVMLTIMSIINSTVLFGEMINITNIGRCLFVCGLFLMGTGVYFLSAGKRTESKDDEHVPLLKNKVNEPNHEIDMNDLD